MADATLSHMWLEISKIVSPLLPSILKAGSFNRLIWQIGFIIISFILAYFISKKTNDYIINHFLKEETNFKHFVLEVWIRSSFAIFGLTFILMSQAVLKLLGQGIKLLKIFPPLLISLLAVRIFIYLLRQIIGRESALLKASEKLISIIIWGISALYITGTLSEFIIILDDFHINFGTVKISLLSIFQAVAVMSSVLLITLWLNRIAEDKILENQHIDLNLKIVLNKVIKAFIFVTATMIALPLAGINVTILSVFGGALGVGLGFGLQKIASNYISGFIILLDKSVKIGDMVTIDNHYGQVSQLNARYVVVRDLADIEYIIPNETLISSTVINHSYSERKARVPILFNISYTSDIAKTKEIALMISSKISRVLADPKPQIFIKNLGNSGIDFELAVWVTDPEEGYLGLKSMIYEQLLEEFEKNNIAVPYPRTDIHLYRHDQ